MLLEDGEARRRGNKRELVEARPSNAPSFVKSRMLRPLQTHFLLIQQIFFVLVCIHPGTPRVPPRVLASGPNPAGATRNSVHYSCPRFWYPVYWMCIEYKDFVYNCWEINVWSLLLTFKCCKMLLEEARRWRSSKATLQDLQMLPPCPFPPLTPHSLGEYLLAPSPPELLNPRWRPNTENTPALQASLWWFYWVNLS